MIISSVEGSLESIAIVTDKYNNSLCSTGFYVISSKKINSETLLVLFKSELMQNILKQNCTGTILTAINKDDFANIPVPLIDRVTQNEIKSRINESFQLREKSDEILKITKHAVEMAIEQEEEVATRYIKSFKI